MEAIDEMVELDQGPALEGGEPPPESILDEMLELPEDTGEDVASPARDGAAG